MFDGGRRMKSGFETLSTYVIESMALLGSVMLGAGGINLLLARFKVSKSGHDFSSRDGSV
jgi:hypothetical protein